MKKFLSIVAALLLCAGVQAQIVSSTSRSIKTQRERPSETVWLARVGMNIMNLSGGSAEGLSSKMGYNVNFEFNKPMGEWGAYWGMNFGLGSRGYKVDDVKAIAHNFQYSPFTFGWKIRVTDNIRIDPHIGVYASIDYAGKIKEDGDSMSWGDMADYDGVDYRRYDVGMNSGVGVWYDRFNLDLCYQCGFVDVYSDYDGIKTSNFMIRLGIAF